MFRRASRRLLVEPGLAVVCVRLDDAVLHPAGEGGLGDFETCGELLLGEQPAGPQAIEARAESIRVHEVSYAHRREAGATLAGPRSPAGTEPACVEAVGELVVNVLVEQAVDALWR